MPLLPNCVSLSIKFCHDGYFANGFATYVDDRCYIEMNTLSCQFPQHCKHKKTFNWIKQKLLGKVFFPLTSDAGGGNVFGWNMKHGNINIYQANTRAQSQIPKNNQNQNPTHTRIMNTWRHPSKTEKRKSQQKPIEYGIGIPLAIEKCVPLFCVNLSYLLRKFIYTPHYRYIYVVMGNDDINSNKNCGNIYHYTDTGIYRRNRNKNRNK